MDINNRHDTRCGSSWIQHSGYQRIFPTDHGFGTLVPGQRERHLSQGETQTMSHTSPPLSTSQYGSDLSRQTNITDYEKVRHGPEDRFSQQVRDGSYNELLMPRDMSRLSGTRHLRSDQQYSYPTGTHLSARDLGYNIPSQEDGHTSPTSNLTTSNYQRQQTSPIDGPSDFRQNNLSSDQMYNLSHYRTAVDNRRNTLFPETEEDSVFQALQPEDNARPSVPYNSYNISGLAKAQRADAHTGSLDSLARYGHTPSQLLRRSHQELTDNALRHHRSSSLQTSADNLQSIDAYRNRTVTNLEPTTRLQSHGSLEFLPARASSNLSGDLSKWQQLHKQQLALQQADTKTLTSMTPKSTSLNSLHGYDSISMSSPSMMEKHTVGVMRKAADEIIQEKDKVIENLRLQLLQLDAPYQSTYSTRSLTDNEVSRLKQHAEDLEYQNTLLKTRLAGASHNQKSKIENLELQLGATEHELVSVKSDLTDTQKRSLMETTDIKNKMAEKDQQVREWQRRFMEMRDDHIEVRKKLDSLQRYLSDLPTAEDSQHTSQQLNKLQEEVSTQKTTISNLERKVIMAKKIITVKETEIGKLKDQNSELDGRLIDTETELEGIKTKGLGEELSKAQATVEKLKQEKERIRIDLEKAKKMLEARHRLTHQAEVKHKGEITQLEERLLQEEDALNALREENSSKEEQIAKLRKSIRELSTQNQDLLEQNFIQKEQLSTFERHCSEETVKLERHLAREMRLVFGQLQGLVQICCDSAKGHELDMSVLLGTREDDSDEEYSQSSQSGSSQASSSSGGNTVSDALTLRNRLAKIKDLKKEIEMLREFVSNKVAADMASKIECTTQ